MNFDQVVLHENQAKHVRQSMISVADHCHERVHWGSSLSCVEILIYILSEASNILNEDIDCQYKDALIVSKGHAALGQYAVMQELGLIKEEFVHSYQKNNSRYPEELVKDAKLHIECSTGSLGLGLPYAVGMDKIRGIQRKIFCVAGDGECDEGSVWEAIMLAAQTQLDHLVLVIDLNGLQADGSTDTIMNWSNMQAQIESFGWNVQVANGHDFHELEDAFCAKTGKPTAIIARTVKGKGISFMENDWSWHDRILDRDLLEKAKMEVGL